MKNTQSLHFKIASQYRMWKDSKQLDRNIDSIWDSVHMNKTEQAVLKFISQRSFGVLGASWWKVKNIASSINKSVRMVGYALSSLEEKKVIKRVPVMRSKGGNSSNIVVILPNCRPQIADRISLVNIDSTTEEATISDTETTNFEFKQDDQYIDTHKLFSLFQLKMKDKTVRYGSSYVEKVTNTLFEYAQNLLRIEERQEQMKAILAAHGMEGANNDPIPTYDWVNQSSGNTYKPLGWLNAK